MNSVPHVTTFGGGAAGFSSGPFEVLIRSGGDNRGCTDYAKQLADAAVAIDIAAAETNKALAEVARMQVEVRGLRFELAAARAKVPSVPARILSTGTVRFMGGELWLLNRRESRWSSLGIRVGSWDELFRRFNVAVTDHGTDEHGAWWSVENVKELP